MKAIGTQGKKFTQRYKCRVKNKKAIGNDPNEFTYLHITQQKRQPHATQRTASKMTGCRLMQLSSRHIIVGQFIVKAMAQKIKDLQSIVYFFTIGIVKRLTQKETYYKHHSITNVTELCIESLDCSKELSLPLR
jgi:hypothetical protein